MAEISSALVAFLHEYAGGKAPAKKAWHSRAELDAAFALISKNARSPIVLKQAGKAFAATVVALIDQHYEYPSVQERISCFPKVYGHFVRGDGAGIWMTENSSEGYIRIKENSPLLCLFTEGLLAGLLEGFGARGALIKNPVCRHDAGVKENFCVYELIWVKKNLKRL